MDVVDSIIKTFETYWNDDEFRTFMPGEEEDKKELKIALSRKEKDEDKQYVFFDLRPYSHQKEILEDLRVEREEYESYKNLVVASTGTGKTETMIATVVSEMIGRTLIVVPSNLLRKQTADKFLTFGILQAIGIIKETALKPTVTTLRKTPKELYQLQEILDRSNIIVTTMSLLQRFPEEYLMVINKTCDTLIVDEAHHIAANTWATVKYKLGKLRCLQFTATPFRNDGKKVDGKIIYNFPLAMAQQQGYFQKINFLPLMEFDEEKGDFAIAEAAIKQLESDLEAGYNHLILVRAKDKRSADYLS